MDSKSWQSRSNWKPLPHWWKSLAIRALIGAHHHASQQNAKNWCHHWRRNFSFKSRSTSGPLPPSENHVLHNQSFHSQLFMCKFFHSFYEEHTVQMFLRNIPVMPYIKRTLCVLDLVPPGYTLLTLRIPWRRLISAGSSQTTTSDVYDSVLHIGISRNKPALKVLKTVV